MALADFPVRTLNRSAIVVRPKEPYVAWGLGTDGDAPEHEELIRNRCSVHLARDAEMLPDVDNALREKAVEIFERELAQWSRDTDAWPQERRLRVFRKWFETYVVDLVVDLRDEPLVGEVF